MRTARGSGEKEMYCPKCKTALKVNHNPVWMASIVEVILHLFLLLFFYSFLGRCMEVILKYMQFHRFINRGFLHWAHLPDLWLRLNSDYADHSIDLTV